MVAAAGEGSSARPREAVEPVAEGTPFSMTEDMMGFP